MGELINPDHVRTVAVLGAGTIGCGWAALYLARGKHVTIYDPAADIEPRVRDFIAASCRTLTQFGLPQSVDLSRLVFCTTVQAAVRDADLVQENAPENLQLKRELLVQVDEALGPSSVVASSTSGLLISDLQEGRVGAERYVLAHPFNPPYLIPLVEVCGGRQTAPTSVDWAMKFYRSLGKHPVRLNRELPGHIANRLAAALWREAVHLVISGVATAKDVDAAVRFGPGLRWACMGPHLTYHLGGGQGGIRHFIEHLGPAFQRWWDDLGRPDLSPRVAELLADELNEATEGRSLPELAAERDARLIAVMKALVQSERPDADPGEGRAEP